MKTKIAANRLAAALAIATKQVGRCLAARVPYRMVKRIAQRYAGTAPFGRWVIHGIRLAEVKKRSHLISRPVCDLVIFSWI